jgi:hypothetical protein
MDRHRFDADLDLTLHVDASPDLNWHQKDADLRIVPQVLHMLKNKDIFLLLFAAIQFTVIFLSHQ